MLKISKFLFVKILLVSLSFFVAATSTAAVNQTNKKITFNLDDAIFLSLRSNPNVQSVKLSYVLQKFNLYIQEWAFSPHYNFQASANYSKQKSNGQPTVGSHSYNLQPSMSLLTPLGTVVSVTGNNPITTNYNPGLSLEIMQPLMRGFGRAIVETALNNAKDAEIISRLNIAGTLRSTVTAVITAYLDVVAAERTIQIDESALQRANKSVEQTQLFIKAGRKAGNEIVTVKANVASALSQLENDKNSLQQSRYALLAAIGIDPNSPLTFQPLDIAKLISKYHLPELTQVQKKVLTNDIQYQVDQITLHGSTIRNVAVAEDNARWKLNLTANVGTGAGSGGGFNAGTNSLFNRENQRRSVGLTLQIPIDDQLSKQAILSAKIALKQAKLSLEREKWNKETSAINGYNQVVSAKRALGFAEDAKALQEKTYNVSFQKYLHGLIDSLELQTAQFQLIQSEQTLLRAQIGYLRSLVQLDNLIGNTLKTWQVDVRN